MTEPALFQQQREIWQAFRQAVAQRKLTERNAAQRWQTEQHAADRILEQILNQAKKRCDQEESRATKEYQKLLQDASNTREQIQRQAKQTLQQAEADIQKHHQSEHKQANLVLEQAKNQAQERLRQEESEAISVASAEVKVIKEAWDSARKLAEAKQDQAERVWRQCRGRLEGARLDLRQLIPTEIPPATPDEVLGEADPPQRLEQSLEAVLRAGRAVHDAVDDLLRWRETWQRRRNWGIGGAIATTFVVLIGMSIWNAQIEETNRRATATAFYPTYVAMTTSTAEAEATATAEVQAKATATARAQATATAQAMATATAQAKATATARAMATATAQARATATVQAILTTVSAIRGRVVYGPAGGRLKHNAEDDYVKLRSSEVKLRNFICQVTFYNPYSMSERSWDYGIFFRDTGGNKQYRLSIRSDGYWALHFVEDPTWDTITSGVLSNLDTSPSGKNTLRIVVKDTQGFLFVNDRYIDTLDVSRKQEPGDVLVATGIWKGNEITGKTTRYEGFTVWSLR